MMKSKRLVALGDYHCGHYTGLTPPGWDGERQETLYPHYYGVRRTTWDWYKKTLKQFKPIDVLLVNGDLIDGRGPASGGTELLVMDRLEQVEMAISCVQEAEAKAVVVTFGTAYHTGKYEDFEIVIANRLKNCIKIGGEDNYEINGWIINARHHVGRSSIPHGRYTPIAREQMGNAMWAARGEFPLADVLLRSHVHYYAFLGGGDPEEWLALTLPSLQGYGGKLGTRRMTGTVDVGMACFDFPTKGKGQFTWQVERLRFPLQEPVQL